MRVTILTTGLSHGGAETQLVRVAQGLTRRGHDIDVVTMRPPGSDILVSALTEDPISLTNLDLVRRTDTLRAAWRLYRHLRSRRPDVLCCFMYHANLLGTLVGRAARVPRIVTSIRTFPFGGTLRMALAGIGHRLDSAITANSALVGEIMVKRRVVAADKLVVIPNTIDVDDYIVSEDIRRATRESLGLANETFTLVAIGRAKANKDYGNLLRAVSLTDSDIEVLIAGDIGEEPELEPLRRSLDLTNVRFLGFREDVPALLASADALVLSSSGEGLPNVVLEAHAAGLPVVATDVGGVREVVSDGKSGFVVPPRNPDALAAAITRVRNLSPEARTHMGHVGRRSVTKGFGQGAVIDAWEDVLAGPMA